MTGNEKITNKIGEITSYFSEFLFHQPIAINERVWLESDGIRFFASFEGRRQSRERGDTAKAISRTLDHLSETIIAYSYIDR